MSGRQMLLLIYRSLRIYRSTAPVGSVIDLNALRWRGDSFSNVEAFRNDWEATVENLPERAPRHWMAEILLDKMSCSSVLKAKVDKFRKQYATERKPYHKLMGILERWLSEQNEARNRKSLQAEQAKRVQAAAPAVADPKAKAKAEAKAKAKAKAEAKAKAKAEAKSREEFLAAARAAAWKAVSDAAPALAKGKGKGKDKDKGKGKGDSKGKEKGSGKGKKGGKSRETSQAPKQLCAFFQIGECKDASCRWRHEKARDSEEIARLRALREKAKARSSTPTRKQPCWHWEFVGHCKFEKDCAFAHNGPPGQKKGQGKGPKGKSRSKSRERRQ